MLVERHALGLAAAVRVEDVAPLVGVVARVDADDHRLRAEAVRDLRHDAVVAIDGGVHDDAICALADQPRRLGCRANATA